MVDLDKVPGRRYLKLATANAEKSFHSKQPIAKTLAMELLVYISAEKQIMRALSHVGVNPKTRRVAAVAVGDSSDRVLGAANFLATLLGQAGEDELLDEWSHSRIKNVRSEFEIGEKELEAIANKNEAESGTIERLAIERSAMLAARR